MQNNNSINFLTRLISFTVTLWSILYPTNSFGKVDPANYNFSLDELSSFAPDKTLVEITKKYGKGELTFDEQDIKILKFYVAQIRYKFPVFVTIYKKKSIGYFARLPAYFLHDVFHQSLINRYQKQDLYSKKGNAAIYVWKNELGVRYTYQGQCTITCFPMYLQAEKVQIPATLKENPTILKKALESYY